MNDAVIVKKLIKAFDSTKIGSVQNKVYALSNISFSVKEGEILGVIGKNGSGKTTLLRTIAGIYHPTSGQIQINGKAAPVLQIGIGFKNEISARENIMMYGLLLGMDKLEIRNKINDILKFADLTEYAEVKIRQFSSGMRARLAFATAMQIESDIYLIDEILSVGDLEFKEKSFEAFKELKEKGKTIIHTTHNLSAIESFSDKILFLDNGHQIEIGEPKEIVSKYRNHVMENKKSK